MRLGVVRLPRDRALEQLHGVAVVAELAQHEAEIVERFDVIGRHREHGLEERARRIQTAGLLMHEPLVQRLRDCHDPRVHRRLVPRNPSTP